MNLTTKEYMKVLKFINLIGILILFFTQCNEKAQDKHHQLINKEVNEFSQVNSSDDTSKELIFINDNGCPNCIISFSGYILNYIEGNEKAQDKHYQLINKEVNELFQVNLSDDTPKKLIFINDNGCPNCIISFSGYVLNHIDRFKDNSLILINSKGINVDIDKFLDLNAKNIFVSRNIRKQSKILPDLGIIYLKENSNEVDTIISINASTIREQLNYIENKP
ncbi:hypothetical protein SDC9_84111 [bioreactor metagenome]|uniref:Uncharacterized protein n=1 Tax=bioreactor metagenome TaxID=1076179 RepID=A0A644ZI42_9ZZZZ